jgi:hypothetical protein
MGVFVHSNGQNVVFKTNTRALGIPRKTNDMIYDEEQKLQILEATVEWLTIQVKMLNSTSSKQLIGELLARTNICDKQLKKIQEN